MRIIDLTRRAARSLGSAKVRTLLTSLAIGVGAFTLTLTLAAGNGIRDYTDRLIANNFDPAELIVGRDKEIENTSAPNTQPREYDESVSSMTVGGDGSSIQLKQITDEDITEIERLDFVEQVRPSYQINVRYITREDAKRYTLSAQAYNPGQKPELSAGQLPANGDLNAGEVLLPDDYISLLGFKDAASAVGQTVRINVQRPFSESAIEDYLTQLRMSNFTQQPAQELAPEAKTVEYTVRAVTKKGAASISVAGQPVMLSSDDARELYDYTAEDSQDYGKYLYAFVRVKGGEDPAVAAEAKRQLKEQGYYVQTSEDIQKTITQFVDILQALVGVFGVITIIASVFGIINTMYISVLERTREIGLMKALGMRGRDVSWLFRIEAAWIGFLGGLIGSVLAYVVGAALNPWLTRVLNLGDGNRILVFDLLQIIALVLILMLVAIIAGWLPARKAAKLDPIEALRTE